MRQCSLHPCVSKAHNAPTLSMTDFQVTMSATRHNALTGDLFCACTDVCCKLAFCEIINT